MEEDEEINRLLGRSNSNMPSTSDRYNVFEEFSTNPSDILSQSNQPPAVNRMNAFADTRQLENLVDPTLNELNQLNQDMLCDHEMDEPVDEWERRQREQVRQKEDSDVIKETMAAIKLETKLPDSRVAKFLNGLQKLLNKKEILIQEKEFDVRRCRKQQIIDENEIKSLQSRLQNSKDSVEERADSNSQGSSVGKGFLELRQELEVMFEKLTIAENERDATIEELKQLENDYDIIHNKLQARVESDAGVRRQLVEESQRTAQMKNRLLLLESQQSEHQLIRLKCDYLLAQNQELKQKLEFQKANYESNSYSRKGQNFSRNEHNHDMGFQTTERGSTSVTSMQNHELRSSSGKNLNQTHNKEYREQARKYNEFTEEILDETEFQQNETYSPRKNQTFNHTHRHSFIQSSDSHIDKAEQRRLESLLPEPPKFSADEKSVEIEAFERAFLMKYGSLRPEHQVMLLESKHLVGKALQVCKGLPMTEKHSVQSILTAIRNRLRMSEPDESRRAKSRWESLKRRENQSIEDFCLLLDEIAQKAFKGCPDNQVSSMKTNKLLFALQDEENLLCTIDAEFRKTPEEDHYDVCRILATRHELQVKERQLYQKQSRNVNGEKKVANNRNSPYQAAGNNESQYSQYQATVPRRNGFPRDPSTLETPILSQQTTQGAQKMGPASGTAVQNWRGAGVTPSGNDNTGGGAGHRCSECLQTGCHDPNCSKAPGAAKARPNIPGSCFYCKEQGHFANSCPKRSGNQPTAQQNTEQNTRVAQSISKVCLSVPSKEKSVEGEETPVKILKGRIGNADVDIMLDSGACISLISAKTWKQIVSKNGIEFEKNAIIPDYKPIEVFAANNQKIDLLFHVRVKTSMQSRTRKVDFHVINVDRDNIILGIDQFAKLGVHVHVDEKPRDIKMTEQVTLYPGDTKFAEVRVEGIIPKDQNQCSIRPLVNQVSTVACVVNLAGKAIIEVQNSGDHIVVLKKGDVVATGEFEIIDELFTRTNLPEKEVNGAIGSVFQCTNTVKVPVEKEQIVKVEKVEPSQTVDGVEARNKKEVAKVCQQDVKDKIMSTEFLEKDCNREQGIIEKSSDINSVRKNSMPSSLHAIQLTPCQKEVTGYSSQSEKFSGIPIVRTKSATASSLQKPGLQKPEDVACGGFVEKKTKRRFREEPRPRTDPPKDSVYMYDYDIESVRYNLSRQNHDVRQCPDSSQRDNLSERSSTFVGSIRPLKDPPSQVTPCDKMKQPVLKSDHDLYWSDTSSKLIGKDVYHHMYTPDSWNLMTTYRRGAQEEHRPRKDPPALVHHQHIPWLRHHGSTVVMAHG
ncbi:hypothetical protein CAEBREN_12840 [Caenorhabditis brenneri]|uniref:CCHC-type domain-containing protein n=1 Tax=Caenorhabditis brenneri TaxID=135651 RepID=G0N8Q4_CAEBE|nr:hypothetical protein CAEBREN_12840 [Caenorhabditis brenneri]